MTAEVITIGEELLIGQIVNTNAAWLGQYLSRFGVPLRFVTTIGDDPDDIRTCLNQALQRADIVFITGGLGPTHDDITKKVLAEYFQAGEMVVDAKVLNHVKALFAKRNIPMAPVNEEQALVPAGARVLWNSLGTAPGLLFEKDHKYCVAMPGVPAEMQSIMTESLAAFLKERSGRTIIRHRTLRTIGVAESTLAQKLEPISELEQYGKIAFLPSYLRVSIRISVTGTGREQVDRRLAQAESLILSRVGKYVYGYDDDTLEAVVGRKLKAIRATLAVAESCTGGMLAHFITNVSGSSEYFECGCVTYSNDSKVDLLGVPREVIERHGAVSEECARAMAAGIRRRSGATYGLSTTGIAGPTGGTEQKPVGLVWVGLATPDGVIAKHFVFTKDRLSNKERFCQMALGMLYRALGKG